jgi:hypothetical protein
MPLFNSLLNWLTRKRIHQIELFIKYPMDVQLEGLKDLLTTAKNTAWGKMYDFATISTVEEFRKRLPVNDYNSIKPHIDRVRNGEQNLLWPSEIKWFAKSSGTTNDKSKFIPVSTESLEECHFQGGRDVLTLFINNHPNTQIFSGKGLVMGGSSSISEVNNESYYTGDLSAILIQNLPFWASFKSTPGADIALMDEWESKIEKMAMVTKDHNVTSISGVPSWTLVLIQRIFEITGKDSLLEIWPDLEVFFHGGVNFNPYRQQFKSIIPSDKMSYMETYNASEGFFGIQDRSGSDDMLLMLDYGVFYEFIPINQLDAEHPKTLWLDEVKTGENYAMLITTNGGLWRYLIGDTITFTSTNPFRIKITGRTKNFINAFGEELIIDNAEKALEAACKKHDAIIAEYTAAPVYFSTEQNSAAHEWLIEFEKPPANIEHFSETLDEQLKALNSDYEAKRYKNMLLQKPLIRAVPPKTFYNWLKMRNKLGGQNKVPRLSNDRKYVNEIMQLLPGQEAL